MLLHPGNRRTTAAGSESACGADRKAPHRAADRLSLAAAPTFAVMALLTAVNGPADMICSPMEEGFSLNGMAPMYLLMTAFHLAPWLRLVSRRGSFEKS
ncbi:hypothetical protein [Neorhizobium sp. DT-125]|uniref:hypothetical protein n=1 Tax=Neorhizobium sp. DT-125 TaxID=3396163 RepID=UPI003F1E1D71